MTEKQIIMMLTEMGWEIIQKNGNDYNTWVLVHDDGSYASKRAARMVINCLISEWSKKRFY